MKSRLLLIGILAAMPILVTAAPQDTVAPGAVVVSGQVPDEGSRAAILGKMRELYGAANIVDRLEVGGVVPPPNWTEYMTKLLTENLKNIRGGQMQVNGTRVSLKGRVENEALRQQVVSQIATVLNPTYTVDNALVVNGGQKILDQTLSNRVVEFESGSANLTPGGIAILKEMLAAMKQIGNPKVQIIGHTDSSGDRTANVVLSLARANAVRAYLVEHGIPAGNLSALGSGSDKPVSTNDTPEGRAKNRRIEFRLVGG